MNYIGRLGHTEDTPVEDTDVGMAFYKLPCRPHIKMLEYLYEVYTIKYRVHFIVEEERGYTSVAFSGYGQKKLLSDETPQTYWYVGSDDYRRTWI